MGQVLAAPAMDQAKQATHNARRGTRALTRAGKQALSQSCDEQKKDTVHEKGYIKRRGTPAQTVQERGTQPTWASMSQAMRAGVMAASNPVAHLAARSPSICEVPRIDKRLTRLASQAKCIRSTAAAHTTTIHACHTAHQKHIACIKQFETCLTKRICSRLAASTQSRTTN